MRTDTHVHLRVTRSDRCYARPTRLMPEEEWRDYLRWSLVTSGFDMGRKIAVKGTHFDRIYSQELA